LLDRLGNLWVGDDASDGAINFQGRLWYISAAQLASPPSWAYLIQHKPLI
jgi:hypothetical protein